MKKLILFASLSVLVACSGGYSFTGADVGEAETVSVEFFPNYSDLVQPQLSQTFTEKLRDVFVRQTPLDLVQSDGDLHFEGSIIGYQIKPISAQASELGSVAQNRLTITVKVIYRNKLDESKNFEQNFSRFEDFDANADISTVEGELIETITQQLAENILNQSVGNW